MCLSMSLAGCMHTIHVNPRPPAPTTEKISRSVQLEIGPVVKEGPDHRPGITLLTWTREDVRRAVTGYLEARETFSAVAETPADFTMVINTVLSMHSRDRYWYRIRLHVEMKDADRSIHTYEADHEVEGSFARWMTASDRDPIEAALARALDDVMTQIEADRTRYGRFTGRGR